MSETVPSRDFHLVLKGLRDVRAMAVRKDLNAWAFRQAIITILALDTKSALEKGILQEDLDKFDAFAEEEAEEWLGTR